jgi:hypothetical protein
VVGSEHSSGGVGKVMMIERDWGEMGSHSRGSNNVINAQTLG